MVRGKRPERTGPLPAPPAPHLSPTLVVIDNLAKRVILALWKLGVGGGLGYLSVGVLFDDSSEPIVQLLALGGIVFSIYIFIAYQPQRIRAGANWLSSNAGHEWVELEHLKRIERRTHRTIRFSDSRRRRAEVDSDVLRDSPVLFDLLMRAVLAVEGKGELQGDVDSGRLMSDAPPGYRPPKI
jgi:hypothetical protein